HLAVRPRGDVALLNGVLSVLAEEGLVDVDRLSDHVEGLAGLIAHLGGWRAERAAAACGVGIRAIRLLARTIVASRRARVAWALGVSHALTATLTVALLSTVPVLAGHIGVLGAAPMSITGQCNAMRTR